MLERLFPDAIRVEAADALPGSTQSDGHHVVLPVAPVMHDPCARGSSPPGRVSEFVKAGGGPCRTLELR